MQVHIHRSLEGKKENEFTSLSNGTNNDLPHHVPHMLKSKLLIVDLAGSERIDKSGMHLMIESCTLVLLLHPTCAILWYVRSDAMTTLCMTSNATKLIT